MDNDLEIVGDNIDRAITIEMLPKGIPRGIATKLYETTRRKYKRSLTLIAAEKLTKAVSADSKVVISTGAYDPVFMPKGETDGPPGAAGLARALNIAFGINPIMLCESELIKTLEAACLGAGLQPKKSNKLKFTPHSHVVTIIGFPRELEKADKEANNLLDHLQPDAIITVEKIGRNKKGQYHSVLGYNLTSYCAKVDCLIKKASSMKILTIGIGDGGNEIGFGTIYDEARKLVPFGSKCRCPCEDGIISETETDVLVPASVSNWGAYGVEACLYAIIGKRGILHSGKIESRMLRTCADAGAVDGVTGHCTPSVDGAPEYVSVCLVKILNTIVDIGLSTVIRPF